MEKVTEAKREWRCFQGQWGNGREGCEACVARTEPRLSLRYCGDEKHSDKKPCCLRAP